jgi:hypothetical protein
VAPPTPGGSPRGGPTPGTPGGPGPPAAGPPPCPPGDPPHAAYITGETLHVNGGMYMV